VTDASTEARRRQREASDPDISAWVSANAGTGKTKVLTDRFLRLLLNGVPPEHIVAITFTRAAAAEMENRLFAELTKWAAGDDAAIKQRIKELVGHPPTDLQASAEVARRLLVQVLECPGGIRIQTIHAFCQSLLASFPLEAGLAPHFRALDEIEAAALRMEARTSMLQAAGQQGGALAEAFRTVARTLAERQIGEVLNDFSSRRKPFHEIVNRSGGIDAYVARIAAWLGIDPTDTEAGVIRRARLRTEPGAAGSAARQALDVLVSDADQKTSLVKAAGALEAWIEVPDDDAALLGRWSSWRDVFVTQQGTPRQRLPWTSLGNPDALGFLEAECSAVQEDIETLKAIRTFSLSAAIARLAEEERRRYERLKRNLVAVDYDDLLVRAADLLTKRSASDWILYKLDGGVSHILVDEAQDTAPSQWQVISAVAEDFFSGVSATQEARRTIFAVGDPKQSIYRFQGADPDGFAGKSRQFEERVSGARLPWKSVQLDLSFRSAPALLKAVDQFWNTQRERPRDGEQTTHSAQRADAHGRIEVWPPVEPEAGDERPNAHVRRLAGLMAERIRTLIYPSDGTRSKYGPGDIMVLVRQRLPLMPFVVRALREAGIPVAGVDRMRLIDQPPVIDLIELARFLLHPHDDLALANVLKGPLAGLDQGLEEDQLFALAHDRDARSLWNRLREHADEDAAYRTVYDRLRVLTAKAASDSPFDLFSFALDGEQGSRTALLARLGPDAADAIEEFLFQALEFGRREIPSLERFTNWIEGESLEVKRDMELTSGSVRIMTVHAAKGLEAPIVFIAEREGKPRLRSSIVWDPDDTAIFKLPEGERPDVVTKLQQEFAEEEQREYERLLYVAMTRAKDRIVVASWQKRPPKEPGSWWSNLVRSALVDNADFDVTVDPAFPSVDRGETPAYVFEENVTGSGRETEPVPSASAERPDLPTWLETRAPSERAPRLARRAAPEVDEDGKAMALARGTLAHQLLEHLTGLGGAERRGRAAALAERLAPELPDSMRAGLCSVVLNVLERPEFAFMFAANSRAEVRIAGELDGRLVEGQIDRLIVTDDDVIVIDFKTGTPPASWQDAPVGYRDQVADYVALLANTYPGRNIRGMLFYIEGPVLLSKTGNEG